MTFSFQIEKHSVLISHHFEMLLMWSPCELETYPLLFCSVLKSVSTLCEWGEGGGGGGGSR